MSCRSSATYPPFPGQLCTYLCFISYISCPLILRYYPAARTLLDRLLCVKTIDPEYFSTLNAITTSGNLTLATQRYLASVICMALVDCVRSCRWKHHSFYGCLSCHVVMVDGGCYTAKCQPHGLLHLPRIHVAFVAQANYFIFYSHGIYIHYPSFGALQNSNQISIYPIII